MRHCALVVSSASGSPYEAFNISLDVLLRIPPFLDLFVTANTPKLTPISVGMDVTDRRGERPAAMGSSIVVHQATSDVEGIPSWWQD